MIQTNRGRVEIATPAHVYGASPLSDEAAAWLGGRAQIVTANAKTLQGKESVVSAAGAKVGFYTKTNALASGTALPEAGYAHQVGGARKYDTTWRVYTAQPDNAAWRAYHLKQLKALPGWVQCVFSDSLILSYSQGGKPAKPSAFTLVYTLNEWLVMEGANVASWQAATGMPFIVNGLTAATMLALAPGLGMIENAFGSQTGKLPPPAVWSSTVTLIEQAQAKQWTPWVYVKLPAGASWDAWRNLVVPTMLLIDNGSLLFELGGVEGSAQPWLTREYDHPIYQPNIGLPAGPMYPVGVAWRRDFETGVVIVNPSLSSYTSPDGIVVAGQTGGAWRKRTVTTTTWDAV